MNKILKNSKLLLLCLGLVIFTSCEEDDDSLFDLIVRYQWVGDLGFSDRFGEPLESGLLLKPNGFGTDEQCYFNRPAIIEELPVRWLINGGILTLDYGNTYPLLEIYDLYIYDDELSGVLYVDGHWDGPITLYGY